MNYSLAKELKNAGFQQMQKMAYWMLIKEEGEKPFIIHPDWDNRKVSSYQDAYTDADLSACPTLEELIEACGDVEFRVHCYPKGFGTDTTNEPWFVVEQPNWEDMERCSTPTEAVAKLYLALNGSLIRGNKK
jgi:hypothetical protein